VDQLAGEGVDARDLGGVRLGQEAGGRDQVPRGDLRTPGDRDPPAQPRLVPAGALDGGVEPHVLAEVVLGGDVLGVALELLARGEEPRPVRIGLEGVRVGHRRDVHGQAGVVVDVPGAAEIVLPLQQDDLAGDAQALERDGRAHAAEAGTHDRDLVVGGHFK